MHNWYYDLQTKTRAYRTHANNSLLLSTHYTNSPTHTIRTNPFAAIHATNALPRQSLLS